MRFLPVETSEPSVYLTRGEHELVIDAFHFLHHGLQGAGAGLHVHIERTQRRHFLGLHKAVNFTRDIGL